MVAEYWFFFIGLLVGSIVGLTGLGGGVLMTPLLIISGLPTVVAIGTDIIYSAFTKLFASIIHIREKNVEFKIVIILLCGSLPGLLVGYFFSRTVLDNFGEEGLNIILTSILSIILISLSVISILNEIIKFIRDKVLDYPDEVFEEFSNAWDEDQKSEFLENLFLAKETYTLILGAFAVGLLVQLTSVGSGVLVTILLLNILSPRKVVGTELTHASVLVAFSSIIYFNLGFVDYNVLWRIISGALVGIVIGIRFSKRVPKETLRIILLLVIFVAGIIVLIEGTH